MGGIAGGFLSLGKPSQTKYSFSWTFCILSSDKVNKCGAIAKKIEENELSKKYLYFNKINIIGLSPTLFSKKGIHYVNIMSRLCHEYNIVEQKI